MTILSLLDAAAADALPIAVERFNPQREDLEIDDGRGGYRPVRADDSSGKILVRFDSREARKAGLHNLGTQVYCPALERKRD